MLEDSRELGVRATMEGLGIPMRKPSIFFDWSALAKAQNDLARGGVVRGDIRFEVMHKGKRIFRFWFHR